MAGREGSPSHRTHRGSPGNAEKTLRRVPRGGKEERVCLRGDRRMFTDSRPRTGGSGVVRGSPCRAFKRPKTRPRTESADKAQRTRKSWQTETPCLAKKNVSVKPTSHFE